MSTVDFTPSLQQAEEIAGQIKTQFPDLAARAGSRFDSAVRIAARPGAVVDPLLLDGVYVVLSESNPEGKYSVDFHAKKCTCPDHGKHGDKSPCKHRLAAYIWQQARAAYAPVVKPQPYQPQPKDIGWCWGGDPIMGRARAVCALVEVREDSYFVVAIARPPAYPNHPNHFDYRYPFWDGQAFLSTRRIRPEEWHYMFRPEPKDQGEALLDKIDAYRRGSINN